VGKAEFNPASAKFVVQLVEKWFNSGIVKRVVPLFTELSGVKHHGDLLHVVVSILAVEN
jgi:hypothetical protein